MIASLPVFLTGAISLDYLGAASLSREIQDSLENATRAATTGVSLSNAQRIQLARTTFERQLHRDRSDRPVFSPVIKITGSSLSMSVKSKTNLRAFHFIRPSGIRFSSFATAKIPKTQSGRIDSIKPVKRPRND